VGHKNKSLFKACLEEKLMMVKVTTRLKEDSQEEKVTLKKILTCKSCSRKCKLKQIVNFYFSFCQI
jgi:hypothetical protein